MANGDGVPIGTIIMWGGTDNYPGGWLLCDGRMLTRGEYLELFHAIGHNFGDPPLSNGYDPDKQFYLPDMRGQFIRGVDSTPGGSRDPDCKARTDAFTGKVIGPQVGSVQEDQLHAHTHQFQMIGITKGGLCTGDYWTNASADTSATGGAETRPRNTYLNFLIKAK